ncbi:MAG: NUDIX domain-containing protein [Thermodesulfobacteriota bacterium]|nr:NUDIX domain-containing protein [Thermodesulfobacteriota bacterium]
MIKKKILSAGVIIVWRNEVQLKYLLLRAFGFWDFPKGIVEPGESPVEAAKREVEEETTLNDLNFRWGYDYRETGPYGRGKVARYYIAETCESRVSLPVNPEIGRPEHDEYRWVLYKEALSLVAPRVRAALEWAQETIAAKP